MPRLGVAEVRAATDEEWDGAAESPSATYFHTRSWATVWHRVTGGRHEPWARRIVTTDGLQAVVPISRSRRVRGAVCHYESTVTGKYGGWLSADHLTPAHVALVWEALPRRSFVLRENPFSAVPMLPRGTPVQADTTQVLPLDRSWSELAHGFTKGHRSAMHRAERLGVNVRVAERQQDWRAYFDVYQDALRRWGSAAQASHPWRLFDEMRALGDAVVLWLGEYEGETVGGAIVLRNGGNLTYWHGSTLERAMNLGVAHLVLGRVIEHHSGSAAVLDFNPSGGLSGVDTFKKGFGTTRLESNVFRSEALVERIVRSSRRR